MRRFLPLLLGAAVPTLSQGDEVPRARTQEFCMALELKSNVKPEIHSRSTFVHEVTTFFNGKSSTERSTPSKITNIIQRTVRMSIDDKPVVHRCISEGDRNLNRKGDFTGMVAETEGSEGRKMFIDGEDGLGGSSFPPGIDGRLDDVLSEIKREIASCWSCYLSNGFDFVTPEPTKQAQRSEFGNLVSRGFQKLQEDQYSPVRLNHRKNRRTPR